MSNIKSAFNGKESGTAGGYIYYQLYGHTRRRIRPQHYNDAKSPRQLDQRLKQKLSLDYYKIAKDVLNVGFKERKKERSPYNAVMSYFMKHTVQEIDGKWELVPTKIIHSKGPLGSNLIKSDLNPENHTITYYWQDNSPIGGFSHNDTFCFVIYNITKNSIHHEFTTVKRSDLYCPVTPTSDWIGDQLALYGFFIAPDHKTTSKDRLIATITLQ